MDEEWIYGSEPEQIFATIAEGRPNGMPAWKYTLSTQQIWQLVELRALAERPHTERRTERRETIT